ncbi:MAG: flagellar biosynthesis anti-sigma factor FlgM [Campylobacterota bacterium]
MKVNPQAQSLLNNTNKDLKAKNPAQQSEQKGAPQADKVQELKQQVASGEYKVDINKTAEAMLHEFIR